MTEPKHAPITVVEQGPPPERVNPVVGQLLSALGDRPDPDVLRKILEVQREWEADEAKRAFTAALVALKAELPSVLERDATVRYEPKNGGMPVHYKHTSLAHAMDVVTPHLTRFGFSIAWEPTTNDNGTMVTVLCRLTHAGGHSVSTSLSAPADKSGTKSPSQGVASTITLLQRYTALSLLGIATREHQDPQPADIANTIDTARNVRAVGKLEKYGKTADDAVEYLGKPLDEWTGADIDKLAAWAKGGT